MKKTKVISQKSKGRGPLARKVISLARRQLRHTVVDLAAWFARVLPPLFHSFDYSVVFTTPYILGKPGIGNQFDPFTEDGWLNYFERNLSKTGIHDKVEAYHTLMKYGLSSNYWNEYIFLAYRDYTNNMILLEGVPDILKSLPHSEEGRFG